MSDCLLLVPTRMEHALLMERFRGLDPAPRVARCGFGPVVAAARAAQLIAAHAPRRVLLVGIAGSLDPALAVGSAWQFAEVACHGVGAGSAAAFVPAGRLGWRQWESDPDHPDAPTAIGDRPPAQFAIGDRLDLTVAPTRPGATRPGAAPPAGEAADRRCAGLLLTACAASAGDADIRDRRSQFPDAVAEDMEGFGVAVACRLAGVPLGVVRGISNVAGDRDRARWCCQEALEAAADLAVDLLAGFGAISR